MEFARKRVSKGNTLMMPVQFKTSDGFLHVLPGEYFLNHDFIEIINYSILKLKFLW